MDLRNRYGGDAYPRPEERAIGGLVAAGLMNVQSQVIQNVLLEEISRDTVMQGPLVKVYTKIPINFFNALCHILPLPLKHTHSSLIHTQLTWRVDYNFDRPQATQGLDLLEEKVKLGDIRATLVIQDKQDYADITLNAGTKQETSS